MGKFLLISDKKILTQALRLYLFPEHDVQVRSSLEDAEPKALQDYDLLMVDNSSGAESSPASTTARNIQKVKGPTLWLVEVGATGLPKREGHLSLQMPVRREALQEALDGLLATTDSGAEKSGAGTAKKKSGGKEARPPATDAEFIDLVDIVEEETGPAKNREQLK